MLPRVLMHEFERKEDAFHSYSAVLAQHDDVLRPTYDIRFEI